MVIINPEKIYERSSEVRYRILEGEAVVVRQDVAQVFVLSEVGARVLELLDGKRKLTDVRNLLLIEYAVDEARLEQDLNQYINSLNEVGIIHCGEDS